PVEYSPLDRSIEPEVLPDCQQEGVTVNAYSPMGKERIPNGRGGSFKVVNEIAAKNGKSRSQVALNWLLNHESVVVIPKAIDKAHVRENAGVVGWKLGPEDSKKLATAFAPE